MSEQAEAIQMDIETVERAIVVMSDLDSRKVKNAETKRDAADTKTALKSVLKSLKADLRVQKSLDKVAAKATPRVKATV